MIPNVMDLAKLELLTVCKDFANVVLGHNAATRIIQSAFQAIEAILVEVRKKLNRDLNITLAYFI